ncbi:MAG: 50S ribosomal protein L10 [Hyphomonadaceae bacterium]|nr:50S ribosomal protein L10 [Hyphomonadaceae bacterium]
MDRAQKSEAVEVIRGIFSRAGVVVVSHYSGLTVADLETLRGRLRKAGANLKVVKNRLVKRALEGSDGAIAADLFEGPTAIAFSADPVAAPKIAVAYAKEKERFVLRGGLMGATLLKPADVQALASLPSLDELRGKLIGLIQAPATKVAGILQAPAGQLARVIGAYAAKGSEAA